MPHAEFEFLMGGQKTLTLDDLHDLLDDNEITGFDPVEEAFKVHRTYPFCSVVQHVLNLCICLWQVYDPDGTGYADIEVLKNIFFKLGFDDLGDDDVETLVSCVVTNLGPASVLLI